MIMGSINPIDSPRSGTALLAGSLSGFTSLISYYISINYVSYNHKIGRSNGRFVDRLEVAELELVGGHAPGAAAVATLFSIESAKSGIV
jgi:hypothetical protein